MNSIVSILRVRYVRSMLFAALMIVLSSWLRVLWAGTVKVDGALLNDMPLLVVFSLFVGGLVFYTISCYRLWRSNELSGISSVKIFAYISALIFSCMLPMLSNDIYSVLAYGDASNKGIDVYTVTDQLAVSPYFSYVSELWKTAPCVYGPVSLSVTKIACLIGGGDLYLSLFAYKIIALLWAAIFIEAMSRVALLRGLSAGVLLFILLNPLFLLQSLGQLHCDGIAVALVACMLYFFDAKRWYLAFAMVGLAVLAKMSYVLVLPYLIVGLYLESKEWSKTMLRASIGLLITALTVVGLYLPYCSSSETVTKPFNFLVHQSPSKSIVEIGGDILYFAPQLLKGSDDKVQATIHRTENAADAQNRVFAQVGIACKFFALLMSAFLLLTFFRSDKGTVLWTKTYMRLLLLFLLFYSPIVYPWYPILMLPFVLYESDLKFMQWAFVFTFLITLQDTVAFADRHSLIYYLIIGLTFLTVIVYVWRFRRVYLLSLKD